MCLTAPVTRVTATSEHGPGVGKDILLCAISCHPGPTARGHDACSGFTPSPGGLRLPPLKEMHVLEEKKDGHLLNISAWL